MERVPASTVTVPAWKQALGARWATWLPAATFALAAFLIIRNLVGGGASTPPATTVDAGHADRLAANIAFFEAHVAETGDNLSYNRLTSLYLQRSRETGDVSDIRRAELSATRSLENAPGDYGGLLNLALVRIAQHDFEGAAELARQAGRAIPTRVDHLAVLGDAEMALGQYDAADRNYRAFLDKTPGFSAFSRQAALAEVRGNVPLAEQFWKAAIDADRLDVPENSAWAHVQLGNLSFTLGRIDDAEEEFDTAARIFPGYPAALGGQGKVAAARGDFDTAIARYGAATARIPVPEYVAALGDLYQREGKSELAGRQFGLMGAFAQLFEANGIRDDLVLILFALDHHGDTAATLDAARVAYERRPSVAAADVYGWALYRAGQWADADRLAGVALAQGTKDASLFFHAGMIAKATGDEARARELLQRALDLNPHFSLLYSDEARATLSALKAGR